MELSIVIPLYNEEKNVPLLLSRLEQALASYQYELILVDDGSTDQTISQIHLHANHRVRLVSLNYNQGQTYAMKKGIALADGDYIVTMDGDLQNDPSDIPRLLNKLVEGGYDMVAGYRKKRKDPWHHTFPSRLANWVIRTTTGVHVRDYGCTLKVFRANLAKSLDLHGELHRFIPVLAHLQGARIGELPVHHAPRLHGKSNYGLNRTFKVISDLLLVLFFKKYWSRAMHLFGTVGLLLVAAGSITLTYLIGVKLLGYDIGGRPLLLLGMMSVLGGLQFVSFGFIAEMLYRLHQRQPAESSEVTDFNRLPSASPDTTETLPWRASSSSMHV
ncbi:glycosyltransferase family 2 protein [Tunicatimonas pelagia]|uniref:glycosyltransferase family 2 protein n=1 Tax=Tunicatimonas pelagia TaxID=931531 RepID=UPI00266674C3|nr:glycosyltransferase family 2 protein [Tunicatimonas pelagia]WKN42605.1 glycosyltransferase family 2 protein [Tunicatimonas pelagia]